MLTVYLDKYSPYIYLYTLKLLSFKVQIFKWKLQSQKWLIDNVVSVWIERVKHGSVSNSFFLLDYIQDNKAEAMYN